MLAAFRRTTRATARAVQPATCGAAAVGLVLTCFAAAPHMPTLQVGNANGQALVDVTVTGVAPNNSSARSYFQPVVGARDYRVYDAANPTDVKYAGMVHLSASPACPGLYCLNHFVMQADGVTPAFPYQIASGAAGGPGGLDVPATDIEFNGLGDGQ